MAHASEISILVAGLGSIGRRHARLLSERDSVRLILCDVSPANLTETREQLSPNRGDVIVCENYDAALREKPNIVFICTPNHLHIDMAEKALRSRADVFLEKPLSDSCSSAETFLNEVSRTDRLCHVGYMLRFDDGLVAMKKCIDEGRLGNIVGGRAMVGSFITLLNARDNFREKVEDTLVYDYTHELDFLYWLFGDIRDVTARKATLGSMDIKPTPNIVQMILTSADGALIQVHMDYIQHPQRRILEVYGDRGTISYDFMTGEIRLFAFGTEHQWTSLDVIKIRDRWDDLFRSEHADILESFTSRKPSTVDGQSGLASIRLAEMAIQSYSNQR